MASSAEPPDVAARRLGELLTGATAKGIADRLADGDTLSVALGVVDAGRRPQIRELLERCAGGATSREPMTAVLRAVQGARSITTTVEPRWTMPGHLVQGAPLTSSVTELVDAARTSVTCSTFNFRRSSSLWNALRQAARRPGMLVRVYVDADVADAHPVPSVPTTTDVAKHLRPATVLRTRRFDGAQVRNHAKFVAIDHRFLLVTSANFSWSAEYGNVELGVFIDNANLTQSIEAELRNAEDAIYELVRPSG